MNNFYFIGVDVSKKKLDFCVMFEKNILHEEVVVNHQSAVIDFIHRMEQEFGIDNSQIMVCAEHTGKYTYPLICACEIAKCKLWLEHPASIKYSSGMQRGKNDRIDARRIALYASRFEDNARLYERPDLEIEELKQLEAERSLYIVNLGKYKAQLKDQKDYMPDSIFKKKEIRLKKLIKQFKEVIDSITTEMQKIINTTATLSRQHKLLQSVDGVGPVVALKMIVATEAFTKFENARQFNCYAGIAPFQYTSGSSLHSKARVSHRADKCIKTLLHLAAISVIGKAGGELKEYYLRKTEEGKHAMTVINAVRAKIVARMFAVIKKNEVYKPIFV